MDKKILEWIYGKRNWIYAAFACFAMMAVLNMDLGSVGGEAEAGGFFSLLAVNIKKLEYILPTFTYRDAILSFLLFFFFLKTDGRWPAGISRLACRIPAALAAFFLVFGYSFRYTNSWDLVLMDTFHKAVSALMAVGFYLLFARICQLTLRWLKDQAATEEPVGKAAGWLFGKHAFLGPFLVILLCWSPYILAKFPGAAMPETLAEMRQYYWGMVNNYYPPLHTVAMSLVMELGNLIWSYSFGFFLNLVIQLALLLSAFAWGFVLMERWRTPYVFRYAALAVICLVQFYPMEATIVEKDIPYAACVLFLFFMLCELVRTVRSEEKLPAAGIFGMVLACMGVCCNRNEGFYLVFFTAVGMGIYIYCTLWRKNREKCRKLLAVFTAPILLFAVYQKILLPACGVEDNGLKEALSIPFQQTARYVRDYGYEVSEAEAEIISRVLDYENLGELYDPVTSDPVKYTYHAETRQDLLDYFCLWFRQLLKHPGSAVEATMNNAYGWFYQEGYAHNYMMDSWIEGQEIRWEIVQPDALAGVRQVMERIAKLLSRVPVINWFENAGFVSWATILAAAVLAGSNRKKFLLPLIPLLTALLVCVAAPTFNFQMRYIMPVMFCVPYFVPIVLLGLKEETEEKGEKIQ